ncbi:MAG TPA: hypothetical protein VGN14_00420 [Candidatus Elarobacter sp.]
MLASTVAGIANVTAIPLPITSKVADADAEPLTFAVLLDDVGAGVALGVAVGGVVDEPPPPPPHALSPKATARTANARRVALELKPSTRTSRAGGHDENRTRAP